MTTYVGSYALDLDWTTGVVGWSTSVYTGNTTNGYTGNPLVHARHVTLADVIAANPARRDDTLRCHREALTLLALCQAKLQLELDNVERLP